MKKMSKKIKKIYGNSKVLNAENFEAVMSKYELVGKHMSVRAFHRDYVSQIEPAISLTMWQRFMRKHLMHIQIKSQEILERVADNEVQASQMEESSTRKMLAIADISLDAIISNPELLNTIPMSQRLNWLFQTMSARDSRMNIMIKKNTEVRKQNVFDELLKGAQYGDLISDDMSDGQVIQKSVKVIDVPVEPIEPIARAQERETIAFNPEDIL